MTYVYYIFRNYRIWLTIIEEKIIKLFTISTHKKNIEMENVMNRKRDI